MDTVTLTNDAAFRLFLAIRQAGEAKAPIRFTYALGRTKRALQPIVEAIEAAQQAQHAQYLALCRDHAEVDEAGQPVEVREGGRQGYKIDPAQREAFTAAVAPLNEELAALMAQETTAQVHRVPLDVVPELTGAVVDALWPMLDGGDGAA